MGRHLPGYRPTAGDPRRLLGWSIGAVVDNETLVQSRPILRGAVDPIDDLVRTPTPCTVGVFSSSDGDDFVPRDVVRIARFRRWVAVDNHAALGSARREALLRDLPDFLARDAVGKTDGELLLLGFVAGLHRRGAFGKALPPAEATRAALADLREAFGPGETEPLNLFITDGRNLGIIHETGTLLTFEPSLTAPAGREFRVAPTSAPSARASMFIWRAGPPSEEPEAGAERLGPGIYSVSAGAPARPIRDA